GPMPVSSTTLIPASGPTTSLLCDPGGSLRGAVVRVKPPPLPSPPSWHPNRSVSCLGNGRAAAVARESMGVQDDDPPQLPDYLSAHRCFRASDVRRLSKIPCCGVLGASHAAS